MGMLRCTAAAAVWTTALVGCALISGAADLTVVPADGDGGAETSASSPDGSNAVDGAPSGKDGSDGISDGAVNDARVPTDGGDGGSRLRDVTFEDGLLLGAHGGDSSFGSAAVGSVSALSGGYSLRINKALSGVQIDVPPQVELFATALVRVDVFNFGPSTLFGIVPEAGGTVAELRVQDAGGALKLALVVGGTVVAAGGALTVGTVYRVGFHIRQDATTHLIEIFAALAGAPFSMPVVASSTSTLGRSVGLKMGVIDFGAGVNNVGATFDNLSIDTLAMPPP